MNSKVQEELEAHELLGWAEFSCWTALVLTPIIWWLQGPSVSKDQFIVRTALVSLAGVGAIALRLIALIRRFRRPKQDSSGCFDRTAAAAHGPSDGQQEE